MKSAISGQGQEESRKSGDKLTAIEKCFAQDEVMANSPVSVSCDP